MYVLEIAYESIWAGVGGRRYSRVISGSEGTIERWLSHGRPQYEGGGVPETVSLTPKLSGPKAGLQCGLLKILPSFPTFSPLNLFRASPP